MGGSDSWAAVLHDIETQLGVAEAHCSTSRLTLLTPWNQPTELGQMPPDCVEWARSLLQRHADVIARLHREAFSVSRDLQFIRHAADANSGGQQAVFFDAAL